MLPEITRKVQPPRALSVPFPLGYPLGAPDAPEAQSAVLRRLLRLCERDDVPVLERL
jgi:hypothetical protein